MTRNRSLGAHIRHLREAKGLTQSGLASQAGISKAYLSQIEGGKIQGPSAKTLHAVAVVLGTTVARLLGNGGGQEHVSVVVTDSLRAFARDEKLDEEEVRMLAGIRYRGRQPQTEDDWRYLYESIKRSLGDGGSTR
ncbi:MAG TPA: helix-turn-helix transcriptional regulator [Armatimonadota bacterium]|nr:helix-turn-helix transcriptional regulator [Armatimonadota bacterium]